MATQARSGADVAVDLPEEPTGDEYMRAVVYTRYGSPDVLELREVEKPAPAADEVVVRVTASTVSAVDSTFRQGTAPFARLATGLRRPKSGRLGSDFAGIVEAVGESVRTFRVGDRVFGESAADVGTHAEYVCVSETGPIARTPAGVTDEEAAAIPYGALTALPFLRDHGHVTAGDRVLIIGASGAVGTAAVQLATHLGATVTGVCGPDNVDLVASLGAETVVDYTVEDFTHRGETYDVIFDTVGKSSFARARKSLVAGGVYLTTVLSMGILLWMAWTAVGGRKRAVIALTGLRDERDRRADLEAVSTFVADGVFRPVVDRRYPFDRIGDAHGYVDAGHKAGNVVLTVAEPAG